MPTNEESDENQLILRGKAIREDSNSLICLDDIWTLAKGKGTRSPSRWKALPSTKRLVEALKQKIVKSALLENKAIKTVLYSKRGRGNKGTYAHPILAAAYAGYLSEKLEIEVREVWLRYRSGDAKLADEILQRASAEDNRWAAVRALGRAERRGFTDTLRDHGVTQGGYPRCTNAVYQQILNGTARQVRERLGLPKKANLRDNLDTDKLSYLMAAEALATDRINEEDCRGDRECERASSRSASFIREAIERDKKDRQKRLVG